MKCINKFFRPIACCLAGFIMISATGCGIFSGSTAAELDHPYDVYETTKDIGITEVPSSVFTSYFSENLCVIDNISIGTDATDSQVATGAGTFNLATGEVVYAQNIYEKLYPASTTKILTAYIILKYCDNLDDYVTVSEYAADQEADSSVCEVKAGDIITVRDLLYGLMLPSGNDAAIALAEYLSGSVEAFAELMNQEALALGATQSHFVNPNGLPDPDHYTSVYDLYLIMNAALQYDTFVQLINTTSYTAVYTDASGNAVEKTWNNTNRYLKGTVTPPDGFTIIGGKTGTTGEAGYCLVLYSRNAADQPIISIVLKADCVSNLYLLMNQMLQGFAN